MIAAAFLAGCTPVAVEDELWGTTPLRLSWFLTTDEPSPALVTSVRAIVLRDDAVLVLREPDGRPFVIPGGRCEAGESFEATVRREVLEETGWTLGALAPLGCIHLRNLGPEPPGNPYPYPDAFQLVWRAEAAAYRPEAMVFDQWVASSAFVPLAEVLLLPLRPGECALLVAALAMC
jgi:8-oxo-dGTP pyrophosphatase MutT (NUDIX family)